MQCQTQGPREPPPPGPALANNLLKGPLTFTTDTANVQPPRQTTAGPHSMVRPLTWPSSELKNPSPTDRPQLPSLSSMFGYLDHQPPPPPPPASQYASEDSGLFQLKQSLASDVSKSVPKLEQRSLLAPSPPSLPSLPASLHQNDFSAQHHQRMAPHPHHRHRSHSNAPLTPYENKSFSLRPALSPIPHQHHLMLHGQQHHKSIGQPPHLPPAPIIQGSLPPSGPMGTPGPPPHHTLPAFVGMPGGSPHPPEPLQVSTVSIAPPQQQQRDDLSAEDEQNVAISVYLADSDVVPQLLENGRYQCPLCPRNYKYAKHVRRHIINHTNIYPHSCPRCNALFRRKDAQRRHMQRIHPDIPPHTYMNSRLAPDSDDKSDESR